MPPWSLRSRRARRYVLAMTSLAALARGAPLHPLVDAATALYQHDLPQACDVVRDLARPGPGLTSDDLARLELLAALRAVDERQDAAAREGIGRMLQIDPSAELPPFASKLRKLFEESRARAPAPDPAARAKRDEQALAEREPEVAALLRAVDALYSRLEISGALLVLDQASARPMPAPDHARVALRRGILLEEKGQEREARASFQEALKADPSVPLPDYAPEKTRGVFKEEALRAGPIASPKAPAPSGNDRRRWGVIAGVGGLVLLAGGVVAGIAGLSSYRAEAAAAARGDYAAYLQSYAALGAANNVADALYGAGAVALGVGVYLSVSAPGEASVGAGAGHAPVMFVVGGHF